MGSSLRVMPPVSVFILAIALGGCASGIYNRDGGDRRLYTLVNLRVGPNGEVSPMNYERWQRLPVCTAVKVRRVGTWSAAVTTLESRRDLLVQYNLEPGERRPYLRKLFGKRCPRDELDSLSDIDREGIRRGKALEGMTRKGVIVAIGYPPAHWTPNLRRSSWIYLHNRYNRFEVEFVDDLVVNVRE